MTEPATSPHISAAPIPPRLALMLSIVAGLTDLTGFLTLGHVFTAHVTGNIALLASDLLRDHALSVPQLLVVPVFAVAVAAWMLLARACGTRALPAMMWVQFLLLVAVCVTAGSSVLHAQATAFAAAFAVCAMASHFALSHVIQSKIPATATMTVNLTNVVVMLCERRARGSSTTDHRARLRQSASLVAGFFCGCLIAAIAVNTWGRHAWLLPMTLAGVVALLCEREHRRAH